MAICNEILIEFGDPSIGTSLPYGRDQYTRMGHIAVMGHDNIDYGLNTNDATWFASSSYNAGGEVYLGYPVRTTDDGLSHHMNNVGYKWYKWVSSASHNISYIQMYTGAMNPSFNSDDFPHIIKITLKNNGVTLHSKFVELAHPTGTPYFSEPREIMYTQYTLARLESDGDLLLDGEVDERAPKVTRGLVAYYPFDSTEQGLPVKNVDISVVNGVITNNVGDAYMTATEVATTNNVMNFTGATTSWVKLSPILFTGSNDFLMEFGFCIATMNTNINSIVHLGRNGGNEFLFAVYPNGSGYFNINNSAAIILFDIGTFVAGTYYEVQIKRSGSYITGSANGVLSQYSYYKPTVLTVTSGVLAQDQDAEYGGFNAAQSLIGYISYFKFSRSIKAAITNSVWANDGIYAECTTTNLINGTDTIAWVLSGNLPYVVYDDAPPCGDVVKEWLSGCGDDYCAFYGPDTAAAGETYTVSCWAKGSAGGEHLQMFFNHGSGASPVYTSTTHYLTTEWKLYTFSTTCPTGTTLIKTRLDNDVSGQKIRISGWQLEKKLFATSYVSGSRSASSISLPTSLVSSTHKNLLEGAGNCEDLSKFTTLWNATQALDTTKEVFGVNCVKGTLTSTIGSFANLDVTNKMVAGKYYLVSAYLAIGNCTSVQICIGAGNIAGAITSTTMTRSGIKVSGAPDNNTISIRITGTSGQYGYADGIMVNEITAAEYTNDSVATLLARYGYADTLHLGNGAISLEFFYEGEKYTDPSNHWMMLTHATTNNGEFDKINMCIQGGYVYARFSDGHGATMNTSTWLVSSLKLNDWNTLSLTWDVTAKVYSMCLNGEVKSGSALYLPNNVPTYFWIGIWCGSWLNANMKLRNIAVYNATLTSDELVKISSSSMKLLSDGTIQIDNFKESAMELNSSILFPLGADVQSNNKIISGNESIYGFEDSAIIFTGTGTESIVTTPVKTGTKAFQYVGSASNDARIATIPGTVYRAENPWIEAWVYAVSGYTVSPFSGVAVLVQTTTAGAFPDGYFAFIDPRGTSPNFQIRKKLDTSGILATSTGFTVSTNTWYRVRLEINGENIVAKLWNRTGTLLYTLAAKDSSWTSGKYGLSAIDASVYDEVRTGRNGNLVFEDSAVWVGSTTTNLIPNAAGDEVGNFTSLYSGATLETIAHPITGQQVKAIKLDYVASGYELAVCDNLALLANTDYVLSYDAWVVGATSVILRNDLYPDTLPQGDKTITNICTRYSKLYNSASSDMTSADIRFWNSGAAAGTTIYITNIMLEKKSFISPYTIGTRETSCLKFNLNNSLGLDWSGNWSIVYWKKPVGTNNNFMNGYSLESLGCNGNSVGGGYIWWGKNSGSNALVSSTPSAIIPTEYFDHWQMISLVKSGTTLTIKTWGIGGIENVSIRTSVISAAVANYFVTQYGYDFQLGGYDNAYPCNAYYKDLMIYPSTALSDDQVNAIYKTKMKNYKNGTLQVQGFLREGEIL